MDCCDLAAGKSGQIALNGGKVRAFFLLVLTTVAPGCGPTPEPAAEDDSIAAASVPLCTTGLAAWPIRVKIVGELEKIGSRTLCEGEASEGSNATPLTIDGLPLALGTDIESIYAAARLQGARIVDTYAGRAIVFQETYGLDVEEDQPWAETEADETRRYWINEKDGQLIGFRACINFDGGEYRNQLNRAFSKAFGSPQIIRTVANITWAPELRMKWENGATFRTSNDPNTARLDFGEISDAFSWKDIAKNIRIYHDLVRREDQFDRKDFWIPRMQISQENCLVDDELKDIISPLLETGVPPDS